MIPGPGPLQSCESKTTSLETSERTGHQLKSRYEASVQLKEIFLALLAQAFYFYFFINNLHWWSFLGAVHGLCYIVPPSTSCLLCTP